MMVSYRKGNYLSSSKNDPATPYPCFASASKSPNHGAFSLPKLHHANERYRNPSLVFNPVPMWRKPHNHHMAHLKCDQSAPLQIRFLSLPYSLSLLIIGCGLHQALKPLVFGVQNHFVCQVLSPLYCTFTTQDQRQNTCENMNT